VQRTNKVNRALACLRTGSHQVQERTFLRCGEIEATLLEDGAELLLLLHDIELRGEEHHTLCGRLWRHSWLRGLGRFRRGGRRFGWRRCSGWRCSRGRSWRRSAAAGAH